MKDTDIHHIVGIIKKELEKGEVPVVSAMAESSPDRMRF